jgi:predicted choloylglycine hydrolase
MQNLSSNHFHEYNMENMYIRTKAIAVLQNAEYTFLSPSSFTSFYQEIR